MTRAFLDTNVLVYLLTSDPKARLAAELIADGGTISIQVLNEFVSVARRKHSTAWDEIEDLLGSFQTTLEIRPLTLATQEAAVRISRRFQLHIYDANILAAASEAGCEVVYSEDMQDGMVVGGLTIRNPFLTP